MANIGENIRKYRKEKGFSQRKLEELTNIDHSRIAKYENNKTIPTYETLMKISDALNVNIGDLYENRFSASEWDHSEIHKSSVTLRDLGYKCYIYNDLAKGYVKYDDYFIVFDLIGKKVKNFICYYDSETKDEIVKPYSLTVEEVTAINNEMEILGWRERKNNL